MDIEIALRRLSFAEAGGSAAEAMVAMARHRQEAAEARTLGAREDALAAQFEAEAKDLHRLDKRA
ncbi:MAG TPA: hypothetical protein VHA07_06070 [Devosia sp.]|nr:hypothetical protein [Devosia sp.]